jgi:AraC-like DNA-binding protein
MVYGALKRPELFHQKKKYPHSVLKESEKGLFQRKLTLFLSQEKPYLNPSLSLIDIAQKLDIAPRYVSQIINETFRQNFHDFVNTYRIEESKRLLSHQHQPLNILGIAFQAGFSSKSAFNNAFKKHTGMTPKEYRKQQILASKSRTSVPSPKLFYPPPAILPFHKLSKKMS